MFSAYSMLQGFHRSRGSVMEDGGQNRENSNSGRSFRAISFSFHSRSSSSMHLAIVEFCFREVLIHECRLHISSVHGIDHGFGLWNDTTEAVVHGIF